MKVLERIFRSRRPRHQSRKAIEARFLRLYSAWHETHDLSLRRKLLVRLEILVRQIPHFDLRSRFKSAF